MQKTEEWEMIFDGINKYGLNLKVESFISIEFLTNILVF